MCMLVGNDFLPHSPHLEIDGGALSLMLSIYIDLLPEWGDYLTNKDAIHPERFEEFVYNLAAYEEEHFSRRAFEENEPGFALPPRPDEFHGTWYENPDSWSNGSDNAPTSTKQHTPAVSHGEEAAVPHGEEHSYRNFYYKEKLSMSTPEERREVVKDYMEGLHWVLHYYHKGCGSWEWFFPHLYAPLSTDMVNLKDFYDEADEGEFCKFKFEHGRIFPPLGQLLSVLPPQSAELLPTQLSELMLDESSPLAPYYPKDFTTDQNGKRQSWEAVVKIPFIDAKSLLETVDAVLEDTDEDRMLTTFEKRRNLMGQIHNFTPPNAGTWDTNGDGLNGQDPFAATRQSGPPRQYQGGGRGRGRGGGGRGRGRGSFDGQRAGRGTRSAPQQTRGP
jgi:5'-3' exoribonuclease 1